MVQCLPDRPTAIEKVLSRSTQPPDLSIQTLSAITVWKRLKFRKEKENSMLYAFQEEDGSFCII